MEKTKQAVQPKWFTDMQGAGQSTDAGAIEKVEGTLEERLAAVEQLLEDHGIFPRDQK
jgi:hypothetical protein